MLSNCGMIAACLDPEKEGVSAPLALSSWICEKAVTRCVLAFGASLRALVLTGSLARGEETVEQQPTLSRVLGDAEFLLVFQENAILPSRASIQELRQDLEQALEHDQIRCKVDLSAVHPIYLQRLPEHIFSYELRNRGRVLWGDFSILSDIPAFSAQDILQEDAWRILCNRLIELLEEPQDFLGECGACADGLVYRTAKLYLDLATSFLVFAGAYAPSYREREKNLRLLAQRSRTQNAWPFELADFSARVTACTAWKLSARQPRNVAVQIRWQEAIRFARHLWRWELSQLTDSPNETSDCELMYRWMRRQPASKRIRGWLYVMRNRGWLRSWHDWGRWRQLARQASPRYCVYHAASELAFQLPSIVDNDLNAQEVTEIQRLGNWLPLSCDIRGDESFTIWQRLASAIVSNYHMFLEKTRA
jgi:hypothetical protein